jgi:hypothetical protein
MVSANYFRLGYSNPSQEENQSSGVKMKFDIIATQYAYSQIDHVKKF